MSIAIYLSPKSANTSTVIYVQVNQHNPKGWIETPSERAIKLVSGENHAKQRNN